MQNFNVYTIQTTLASAVILSELSIYYSGQNQLSSSNTNKGGHIVSFNLDANLEYDSFIYSTLSPYLLNSQVLSTLNT